MSRVATSAGRATGKAGASSREIPSCMLMRGDRTIVIVHRGERYTLRNTTNNKLILTK